VTDVQPLPAGSLSAVLVDIQGVDHSRPRQDTRPRDRSLVREVNSAQTWVYQGGGNFPFPSATELSLWPYPQPTLLVPEGSLSVLLVSGRDGQDSLQAREDLPAEGTLLQERTGTQTYRVTEGRKVPVSGHDPSQVKLVPDASIHRVPNG
jgi:hypothetical protein